VKDKINELPTQSKNQTIGDLYGGIDEFKIGNQPGTNLLVSAGGDRYFLVNFQKFNSSKND
jgi:hypothetical protein